MMIRCRSPSELFPYTTLFRSIATPNATVTTAPLPLKNGQPTKEYFTQFGFTVLQTPNSLKYSFVGWPFLDRKSTRLNSSHSSNSYAVVCLKKEQIVLVPRGPL